MTKHDVRSQPPDVLGCIGNILGWLVVIAVLWVIRSPAQQLPDAAYMRATEIHNYPVHNTHFEARTYRIFDWEFIGTHSIHAASLATDLYLTSRGVSHGCEEASSNLGPYPSTVKIVGMGIAEFGGVLALDAGMKALARSKKLPRWFGDLGGSLGAGVGTAKHLSGSLAWTRTNCL